MMMTWFRIVLTVFCLGSVVSQASDSDSHNRRPPAGESASRSLERGPYDRPVSPHFEAGAFSADLNKAGKPEINWSAFIFGKSNLCNTAQWYSFPSFCTFVALENSRRGDRFDCKGQPVTIIKLTRQFNTSPLVPVEYPSDYLSKCFNDVCGCNDIRCKRRHVFRAAKNGDGDVIREFLSCGGNPNMTEANEDFGKYPPFRKWSLLHWASNLGFLDIMRDLITAGADPDLRNHIGETPFHLAALPLSIHANKPVLSALGILHGAGADIRAVDNYGRTALHHMMWNIAASHLQKTAVAKHLVGLGVPPHTKDKKGRTPLDIAKIMLEKGDDDDDSIVKFLEETAG